MSSIYYLTHGYSKIQKTEAEILRDELGDCIGDFQCQYNKLEDIDYDKLAAYIISKFNITKKPQ